MPKHRRTEANGRAAPDQFVSLPYGMLQSEAWRSLSGPALKILMELFTRFNGRNNGALSLSYADAENRLGLGCASIKRAFDELQAKGFVRKARQGHWYGRKASEWELTTKPFQGNPPTHEWRLWRNPQEPKTEVASQAEYIRP